MLNALTVDVEDYFQVAAFEGVVCREKWEGFPSRVEANTLKILDLLEDCQVRGTFFVLGWVAERLPGLAKAIQARGHEVASHGYGHERIFMIGPDRFREDLRRSRRLLEDQCGTAVRGYRAPSFSITRKSLWAIDILIEEGFLFDSSIFPVHHDLYGIPDAEVHPHLIRRPSGTLREFPPTTTTVPLLGRRVRIPVAGGGYLRLLPLGFLTRSLRRVNEGERQPAVIYFHPWEIDPEQPRITAGLRSRFRHYHNLHRTLDKLRALLSAFRFAPMGQVLGL